MDNNHLSIEGSEYVVLENINRIENFFSSKINLLPLSKTTNYNFKKYNLLTKVILII